MAAGGTGPPAPGSIGQAIGAGAYGGWGPPPGSTPPDPPLFVLAGPLQEATISIPPPPPAPLGFG